MSNPNTASKTKSTKIHLVPTKAPVTLRLGGTEPSEGMGAGEYLICCQSAVVERGRVGFHYQVIDGPHSGTGLRQWIALPESGTISPNSRYAQQAALALGGPVETTDDLNNPSSIFVGRIFRAFVGFRKTDRPRGGKHSDEYAFTRKDVDDGLRVHALLSREEL